MEQRLPSDDFLFENLEDLKIGLSWEFFEGVTPIDLDASAVCFSSTGSLVDAAFFNQLEACNGKIHHSGDVKRGEKEGFDEEIAVKLNELPQGVSAVMFLLSAYSGGALSACETTLCDVRQGTNSLCTVTATGPGMGSSTSLMIGMLYRHFENDLWHFRKLSKPTAGRHFAACLRAMRLEVDLILDPFAIGERNLSMDKTFNMNKGDEMQLPKDRRNYTIGLGWTPRTSGLDLDASCVFLSPIESGLKAIDFVYFGEKTKPGVRSTGDNVTGAGEGDDEQLIVELDQVRADCDALAFCVNVYSMNGSFGDIVDSYVRLFDSENQHEYARFQLTGQLTQRGVVFCMLIRNPSDRDCWSMQVLGLEIDGRTITSAQCPLWDNPYYAPPSNPAPVAPTNSPDGCDCCIIS